MSPRKRRALLLVSAVATSVPALSQAVTLAEQGTARLVDLVLLLALSFGAGITIVLAVAGPRASSASSRPPREKEP
jgi:hypothetical protein